MKLTEIDRQTLTDTFTRHGAETVTSAEVTEMLYNVRDGEGGVWEWDGDDVAAITDAINSLAEA